MTHPTKGGTVVLATHPGQIVPIGTIKAIIEAAEISDDSRRALL
jgi:predicted RNA binding protein YcfA (HicA-like mRNA interferase family)